MPPARSSYWLASRAPRYSLPFALPLLLLYELLAFLLSGAALGDVRNGADVLLKSLFMALGGRFGVAAFSLVLFGVGVWLVARDRKGAGPIQARYFGLMFAESAVYALALGGIASALTSLLLHGRLAAVLAQEAGAAGLAAFDLPTQLMISLGAGLYEELLFRVLLVSGLAVLARRLFGWKPLGAGIFAAVLGALVFSLFHYVGAYGDDFSLGSFTFRAIAGLLFSGLYLLRGFGIAAWSHALYDVFLSVVQ
ncbi:MAG: CPBP family intramembrane metalloprotease [Gemmatimonadales bacterium]|nr:CPBP family intramembrane metalloprotease [Gemmatimonadales bacterium]